MANEKYEIYPPAKTVYRLERGQYNELVKKLPLPVPSDNTTDIQAGYLLGVQHVLAKLREGFTVDDDS